MSRLFAERFPTAARLLGLADQQAAADEGGEGTTTDENEDAGGEGADDGEGTGEGTEGGDAGGEGEGGDGQEAATALAEVISAESRPSNAQLMAAFEADAARLVAAERDRCVSVFSSDAGRRNIDGAALLLGDDDFSAASSAKLIKLLGTMGGSARSLQRERLNADASNRVDTGAATDTAATAVDAKAKHRERMKRRNPKGGKKVGATSVDETAD